VLSGNTSLQYGPATETFGQRQSPLLATPSQ
jgi:hypothetical protein